MTRALELPPFTRYGTFMLTGTSQLIPALRPEPVFRQEALRHSCVQAEYLQCVCRVRAPTWHKEPLDGLADRLMFRNAYRRFPDGRESLLNNFTVSANSVAGIRWFELRRRLPGNWTIRQEKTYQPDSTWRWMGSIASDNQGNIALGFSASSATIDPQIRYAGRLATDPLGILSGEQHLFDGTGSQVPLKGALGRLQRHDR